MILASRSPTASDTIDILDGDSATVSIAGTTDGNEAGPVDGVFTVTQTVAAVSDTVIDYTVTGTAHRGHRLRQPVRHGHHPGRCHQLRPRYHQHRCRSALVEGTETVIITLDTITASDPGITIATASDTIDILDGDSATVSIAGTTDGNEAGPVDGVFTVTQTVDGGQRHGHRLHGHRHRDRGHRLRQPVRHGHHPGRLDASATIDITNIVADSLVEGTETVIITLDTITASRSGHHHRARPRRSPSTLSTVTAPR